MRDDSSWFVGVEEENFRTIMKYIIGLIEKDKLLESLVEKLCHRLAFIIPTGALWEEFLKAVLIRRLSR